MNTETVQPTFEQAEKPFDERADADVGAGDTFGDATDDQSLLDAYSRSVTSVVDHVAEAVVNVRTAGFRTASDKQDSRQGGGSGFLISPDGVIVTNSHVVQGATRIEVTLHDGSTFPARIFGDDPDSDIAVIRTAVSGLSYLRFADSATGRSGALTRCTVCSSPGKSGRKWNSRFSDIPAY